MITALYARVSTQRQENEETIGTQILAIRDFASKNGHTIVKEYRDDGWSGTILARPALDQLRLDAKSKLWEGIVVYDPDRIARKYSYQTLVMDELEEAGIKVLFVTTPPAKSDEDRLLYGVKGLFAEYEKARIADRFRLGKLRKAREGHVVTSSAPFGYIYIPKQGSEHGYYRVNEEEAKIVKMIFEWVANEGSTMRKVIKRLHEMEIKPRKSIREVWNTSTLTNMLRNETYFGTAHYLRLYGAVPIKPRKNDKYRKVKKSSCRMRPREEWISIPVPPIIDKELFDRAQAQMKKNFDQCVRNRKNDYLLAGHIFCVCGRRRTGEGPQHGKHLYYRCSDRVYNHPLPPKCHERGVNARIADVLVWDKVSGLMSSPELMKAQLKRWLESKRGQSTDDDPIDNLKDDLEKIKKEQQRYIKLYGTGIINIGQLEDAIKGLRLKQVALEQKISQTEVAKPTADIPLPTDQILDSYAQRAVFALQSLTFDKKRAIIEQVIDRVVADQKRLQVFGYLPISEANYVKFFSKGRDCGVAECREKYAV